MCGERIPFTDRRAIGYCCNACRQKAALNVGRAWRRRVGRP